MKGPAPLSSHCSNQGFTLLEILIAIGIFAAVVGTGYMVLMAGIRSYGVGRDTVDIYQNARAAIRQVEMDLRGAVSPAQSRWNIIPEPTPVPTDEELEETVDKEKEEEKIVFKGSAKDVRFVIQELMPDRDPPWDLSEIRYFVNGETGQLIRENMRSVVEWNQVEWRAKRLYQQDETSDEILSQAGKRQLIMAQRIKDVAFRYSDGNEWKESWDSQEILNPPDDKETDDTDPNAQQDQDMNLYKRGLPHMVEVTLTLSNDDKVRTITEVPAWGKNASA